MGSRQFPFPQIINFQNVMINRLRMGSNSLRRAESKDAERQLILCGENGPPELFIHLGGVLDLNC